MDLSDPLFALLGFSLALFHSFLIMSLPFSKAIEMYTLCNCIQDVYNLWVLHFVLILQGVTAEEIDFSLRLLNNLEIVKDYGER